MKQLLKIGGVAAICGVAAGVSSVAAHHSASMFDFSKALTLTGTVVEFRWVNPHVSLSINGTIKEGEQPALWVLEMSSPGNLVRAGGWRRDAVKSGDLVRAEISPLRDSEKRGGSLRKLLVVAPGEVFTGDIRAQERPGLE
jgi:hypothetical protein